MKTKVTLIALVSIVVAGSALAANMNYGNAQNRMQQQLSFAELDLNNDGAITAEEFDTFRTQRIAERSAEGRRLQKVGQRSPIEALDTNGDGVVSEEEFTTHQGMGAQNQGKGKGRKG